MFDEGALQAKTLYDTTLMVVDLRHPIPEFSLEKEELYDRIFSTGGFNDINFKEDTDFSKRILLRGTIVKSVRKLFNEEMRGYITQNQIYHIESTSDQLLIFSEMKPLNAEEVKALNSFVHGLTKFLGQEANPSDQP